MHTRKTQKASAMEHLQVRFLSFFIFFLGGVVGRGIVDWALGGTAGKWED